MYLDPGPMPSGPSIMVFFLSLGGHQVGPGAIHRLVEYLMICEEAVAVNEHAYGDMVHAVPLQLHFTTWEVCCVGIRSVHVRERI